MSSVTIRTLRLGGFLKTSPSTSLISTSGMSSSRRKSSLFGGRILLAVFVMGASPGLARRRLDLDHVAVFQRLVIVRHAARVLPDIAGLRHEALIADVHAQAAFLQADDGRVIRVYMARNHRALLEVHLQHVHAVGDHQELDLDAGLVELLSFGAADADLRHLLVLE